MISTSLTTCRTDRLTLWLERSLFATVLLACVVALSHGLADPDFWGHVQYGQDALADGLPTTATYTYTAEGFPWINHENICEYLMAWGVHMPGPGGMLVIKNLLGIGVMLLIYRQAARQGVGQVPIYLSMLLVAVNLTPCWTLRPQLMTYTLFTLMIALFDWCFVDWRTPWRALLGKAQPDEMGEAMRAEYRRRWPWLLLLVPMFIVWTNSHGGFVAGFCITGSLPGWSVGRGSRALSAVAVCRWWPGSRRSCWLAAWRRSSIRMAPVCTGGCYGAMHVPPPEIMEWHPPRAAEPDLVPVVDHARRFVCGADRHAPAARPRADGAAGTDDVAVVRTPAAHRVLCHPVRVLDAGACGLVAESLAEQRGHTTSSSVDLSPRMRWTLLGVLVLGIGPDELQVGSPACSTYPCGSRVIR